MYSVFCALAVIFVIGVVPETKGRDLDDIAKLFVKNRRQSNSQSSAMEAKRQTTIANIINETNGAHNQLSANGNGAVDGIKEHDSEVTKL